MIRRRISWIGRIPWMLIAALLLFLLVLGVSRVADFGILDGEPFGAADVERNRVKVDLSVRAKSGELRPLGRPALLEQGDRLELTYGPTRYPYVWITVIDPNGVAHPVIEDRHTKAQGETLSIEPPAGRFVLLCLFAAVPRTLAQIQASLDEDVRLPGLRFAWVIGGEPTGPTSAEAQIDGRGALRP